MTEVGAVGLVGRLRLGAGSEECPTAVPRQAKAERFLHDKEEERTVDFTIGLEEDSTKGFLELPEIEQGTLTSGRIVEGSVGGGSGMG